ncbi:MAG TPA: quinolinate synthase NadA [Firmicutes bacterium]|nr:quinolinate synthase NadA [Bacillota bacterium]
MTNTMERIARLKREQDAVVAAHTYQSPAVQAVADLLGDSFALARKAAETDAAAVYMCGVRFMAEGVKILCPEKRVVLAEPAADCPMARQIDPKRVEEFRAAHPEAAVVAYINTTAELKAVADVCVTSSSAVRIVRSLPQRRVLFIPDQHLGGYVRSQVPEKEILTWDGYCPVHHGITAGDVRAAKAAHPDAAVAIHPECPAEAVALADVVGSTAAIIDFIRDFMHSTDRPVIVATERGVADRLSLDYPGRLFQLRPEQLTCPDMKLTTPDSVLAAMEGRGGEEIVMDPALMEAARASLTNMIRLGG